jgi:hypothetical protein
MRPILALLPFILLSSCGKSDNDSGPGGVTVGEARALDQAAEMIEQRRMPAAALRSRTPSTPASTEAP